MGKRCVGASAGGRYRMRCRRNALVAMPSPPERGDAGQGRNQDRKMSTGRKLRLGAFMRPVSLHTGAWRYPGAYPDANFNFAHLRRFAQALEAAP